MGKRTYSSCAAAAANGNDVEHRIRSSRGHGQSVQARARKILRPNPPQVDKKEEVVMRIFADIFTVLAQLILLCYICTEQVELGEFILTRMTLATVLIICGSEIEWTNWTIRLDHFQHLRPREPHPPEEEYCPLYTVIDQDAQCRSYGFCSQTLTWVRLPHIPQSTDGRTVMLPVASMGGLLFYTEEGLASKDVLLVNPLSEERKILGLGNDVLQEQQGRPAAQDMHRNQNADPPEDAEDADDEEDVDNNSRYSQQSGLFHVLEEAGIDAFRIIMTGRRRSGSVTPNRRTEVYDSRTDTWTTSGDGYTTVRLGKNSSSVDHEGLVITVAIDTARAEHPYNLSAYNNNEGAWSVYTRIVIPGDFSFLAENPQVVSCDDRLFLVTLFVCPTIEAPEDDPEFMHEVVIYEFIPGTMEFARLPETFKYVWSEWQTIVSKCKGNGGRIHVGLNERALAYYDLDQDEWNEYPELFLESDEDTDSGEEIRFAAVCYRPNFNARVH